MKQAIIVVDMLNDFIDQKKGALKFPQAKDVIYPIQDLLGKHRVLDNPRFFLCDSHDENDLEFERFPKHAVRGTWGSAIIPEMNFSLSKQEKLIEKQRYSGFYNTTLEMSLIRAGLLPQDAEITVVGVCTSICVMDTVGELASRDYKIVVPESCVADFDDTMHEMALKRMHNLYGARIV